MYILYYRIQVLHYSFLLRFGKRFVNRAQGNRLGGRGEPQRRPRGTARVVFYIVVDSHYGHVKRVNNQMIRRRAPVIEIAIRSVKLLALLVAVAPFAGMELCVCK